jgi:hypothetical protein
MPHGMLVPCSDKVFDGSTRKKQEAEQEPNTYRGHIILTRNASVVPPCTHNARCVSQHEKVNESRNVLRRHTIRSHYLPNGWFVNLRRSRLIATTPST